MVINSKHINGALGNLAVVIFLNSQFIRTILEAYIPSLTGQGLKIVFIFSIILLVFSIRKIVVSYRSLFIPAIILIYYVITRLLFPGQSVLSWFQLINYVLFPFLFVQLDVDFEKVIKDTLILTAPAIFVSGKIFIRSSSESISMILSHSVLFSVICAIVYLLYYRKKDNSLSIFYHILCAIQIYYLFQVIMYGSRGAILSIFVLFVIYYFFKPNVDSRKNHKNMYRFLVVATIFFFVIAVFQDDLIRLVYEFVDRHNIFVRAIEKTYVLAQKSDILHGRIEIYLVALMGFAKNPFFGNGIDMFFANTGWIYPHNLFLQLAYDGGLLLLISITFLAVNASIRIIKTYKQELFIPWLVLFSCSVPGTLVSGDIWMKYLLWYFIAFCILTSHNIKRNNIRLEPFIETEKSVVEDEIVEKPLL